MRLLPREGDGHGSSHSRTERPRAWLFYLKCRLANAQPEPDFRERSNLMARASSDCTKRSIRQGRKRAVWGQRPALWAANLRLMFDVMPVQYRVVSWYSAGRRRCVQVCRDPCHDQGASGWPDHDAKHVGQASLFDRRRLQVLRSFADLDGAEMSAGGAQAVISPPSRFALRRATSAYTGDVCSREGWLANRSSLTDAGERRLVDQTSASWNRLMGWLRQVEHLRAAV